MLGIMSEPRLIVIGIDGATWDVLMPLVQRGYMPNLKEIIDGGIYGDLRSLIPPVTGAAWLAIATGLNPGKTGIVDFFKRTDGWRLSSVSSRDFEGKSIWDYASYCGLDVCVINYPMLYPPYPVKGIMASGLGTPSNIPSVWPKEVFRKLLENNVLFPVCINYHDDKYNDIDFFIDDIEKYMKKFMGANKLLLNWNRSVNLFITVIQASDWVQHRLWAYIDDNHPYHSKLPKEDIVKVKKWFVEFWEMVDDFLGMFLDFIGGLGDVVIISDHGFGSQYGVFNLGKWLIEEGFTVPFKRFRLKSLFTMKFLNGVVRRLPNSLRMALRSFSKIRKMYEGLFDYVRYIDLERSKAIFLEHSIIFGAIYLIDKSIKEEISKSLKHILKALGLSVTIFYPKEIYKDGKVDLLPDIIVMIEDGRVVVLQSLEKLFNPLYTDEPYSLRHTGGHRVNGIVAMYGKDVAKVHNPIRACILDVAPTVMCFLGLPIPKDIDGKVIHSILAGNKRPRYVERAFYDRLRLAFKAKVSIKM